MDRNKTIDPFAFVFLAIVVVIALLNMAWPHSYWFFGINNLSYLPLCFQVGWSLVVCVAIVMVGRLGRYPEINRLWLPIAVAVLVICFFAFRTYFPALHGDGEKGGSPYDGAFVFSMFPDVDGRLQSFLTCTLSKVIRVPVPFYYYFSYLYHDYFKDNTWILLTLLAGIILVVAVAWAIACLRLTNSGKLGLLLTATCSEPLLNAYGHFDSYIIPVLCVGLFAIALCAVHAQPRALARYAVLAATLGLCYWAHPILLLPASYICVWLLYTGWARFFGEIPWLLVCVLTVGSALSPILAGYFNWELVFAGGVRKMLFHEKLMSGIQVGLPAVVFAAMVVLKDRSLFRQPSPFQALALTMLLSCVGLLFTVWVGYGVLDEFLYSLFGALMISAAAALFLASSRDARLVLYAALLRGGSGSALELTIKLAKSGLVMVFSILWQDTPGFYFKAAFIT